MTGEFIPVNEPLLDGAEKTYLADCIDTGWISGEGQYVTRLERELAARVGRRHGIAVVNGTAALDLAVAALGLGPGDEVILPTFTIISCAAAIVRAGAVPVTVDCDESTWNMDPEDVAAKVSPRTRGIMVVHIYGLPVDMRPIEEIARRHGLKIIEDAAEMHGQTYRGRPCGSFGDISTFSFYSSKLMTTGEGGMVLTDDDDIAERCRDMRNNTLSASRRFVHETLGWNFRMSNLQAAVGVAQLERLDEFIALKHGMGAAYTRILSHSRGVSLPVVATEYASNIYWAYGVVLDDAIPFEAAAAIDRMKELGIGCRPFFWPMHEQPVFRKLDMFKGVRHHRAERIARRGFYLPSSVALSASQIERVAGALLSILK